MQENNDIAKRAAAAITEDGIDFTVVDPHPSIIDRIRHWTLRGPVRHRFVIKPITLGTLVRISRLLLSITDEDPTRSALDYATSSIVANKDVLVEIAALAITNTEAMPPRSLNRLLDRSLTGPELRTLMDATIAQMGILDFFGCMVSVKGMNVLTKAKTATQAPETSGEPSEASKSTSGSDGAKSCGAEAGKTS